MNPRGPNWTVIIAALALACTVLNAAVVFGDLKGQVAQNRADIEALKVDGRTNTQTLAEIKETTTVIKTKLEILLPTNAKDQSR